MRFIPGFNDAHSFILRDKRKDSIRDSCLAGCLNSLFISKSMLFLFHQLTHMAFGAIHAVGLTRIDTYYHGGQPSPVQPVQPGLINHLKDKEIFSDFFLHFLIKNLSCARNNSQHSFIHSQAQPCFIVSGSLALSHSLKSSDLNLLYSLLQLLKS